MWCPQYSRSWPLFVVVMSLCCLALLGSSGSCLIHSVIPHVCREDSWVRRTSRHWSCCRDLPFWRPIPSSLAPLHPSIHRSTDRLFCCFSHRSCSLSFQLSPVSATTAAFDLYDSLYTTLSSVSWTNEVRRHKNTPNWLIITAARAIEEQRR